MSATARLVRWNRADPYDAPTAKLWADRYDMRNSQTPVPGSTEEPPLKRMFLKLP